MKTRDYEVILDALEMTGIYVIREDNHEILYYNQRVKEVAPEIREGTICHELWAGSCSNCPLLGIGNKKTNRSINYDDPFGKAVDITATRILWEDTTPAFVIAVSPHAETASYSYHKILKGNLTLDQYEVIKVQEEERGMTAGGILSLSAWLEMFADNGYVFEEDVERFRSFTKLSYLKKELRAGKSILVCNYRRRSPSGYRWNTLEVIPDHNYTDDSQSVMIYVKDVQDIYKEGLEHEDLNLKNEAILKALGEENFGIYIIDLNTGYMDSIRVAEEDRGFIGGKNRTWDEVLENLLEKRYHPDYREKIRNAFSRKALQETMKSGREKLEIIAEREILGNYHYVSASAHFYDNERKQGYVIMAFQDVDARIRKEIERTRNDKRMAAIIESRYSIMNTVHLESGICERIYLRNSRKAGRTEWGEYSHYIERAARDCVCEEDRDGFLAVFSLESLRKKAEEVEDFEEIIFSYRQRGTSVVWLEEHLFFIRQENGVAVNILGRDITLRKQQEEEENRAAKEKAYIINSLSSMFFATYYVNLEEGTFRAVIQKDEVGQVLGEERDYTEGLELYAGKFIHKEDQEEYKKRLEYRRLLEELSPEHPAVAFEYRKAEKINGETQWIRASVVLAETENGKPKTAVYVAQDITESKQKEERDRKILKDACEAANYANASKSEFLSRMSHDIRTPMNAIIGMTAIAGTHLDDRERVSDCLSKITVSSKHLLSLINEVLDMSKIESGKIDLVEEEFNLSDLFDNLLTIIQPSLKAKKQQLEMRIFRIDHEDVIGDVLRLQQVFTNIMSNAVKYTPEGGKLEIEIFEKHSKIYGYGSYEFIFRDNGIGMSEDFQKEIFEPFSRAEDSRISKIEGTGLGMTIAQNIVRMMNGNIRVESKENEGSQFTVNLYLKQQNTSALDVRELEDLRVLVADDDECACEAACEVLNDIGMCGEWVLSGEEAVEQVRKACDEEMGFFAVILDWKMPGMDGIETAREIRRLVGPEIPIIILSAYDWSDVEEEAREAGVDGFISKPLFKSRLVYMFKQFSGGNEQRAEEEAEQPEHKDFSNKRILLVEDNELNREIAEEIISMTGAAIESAVNGKEAVELFRKNPEGYYDLIFMDIQMPVMDGYQASAAIRKTDRRDAPVIPIIAMTANAFAEDILTSKRAGMNEHITKPLDIGDLMRCMEEWL